MARALFNPEYKVVSGVEETTLYTPTDIAAWPTAVNTDGAEALSSEVLTPSGGQTFKVTCAAAQTQAYIQTATNQSMDWSGYNSIGVWVYIADRDPDLYFEAILADQWAADIFEAQTRQNGADTYKGWHFVGWDTNPTTAGTGEDSRYMNANGLADWNDIDFVRLRINSLAGTAGTVYIGDIIAQRRPRPIISFCFDDSNASDYTAYQDMLAYGWSGTSFLYSATFDDGNADHLQQAEADIMHANGWEFGNHTDSGLAAIQSISFLTSVGTTASVITANVNTYQSGDEVVIAGADQTEYNGTYTITVTGTQQFTYEFAGSATTPATGTKTVTNKTALQRWIQGGYDNLLAYGYSEQADVLAYVGGSFNAAVGEVVDSMDNVYCGRLYSAGGAPMYTGGHPDAVGDAFNDAAYIGFDKYNITTCHLQSNTQTITDLKVFVDEVIDRGGWQVFSGHQIVSGAAGTNLEIQDTVWDELLEYVSLKEKQGCVEVLPIGKVIKGRVAERPTA